MNLAKEIRNIRGDLNVINQDDATEEYHNLYATIRNLIKNDNQVLINAFQHHFQQLELENLLFLIEFVRAEGFFYHDYTKEHGKLLIVIISIAISFTKTDLIFNDGNVMWFITTVYDIIFHQIHFNEFPKKSAKLYFELTNIMLDKKFILLAKNENIAHQYKSCLYFIETSCNYFFERQTEFLVLWKQIEFQINTGFEYWIDEYWPKSYRTLFKEKI